METLNFVFQTDSEEVNKIYRECPNYLIEFSKQPLSNKPYCVVYFSSNGIYYPNTKEAFYQQLVKKNKFEWYKTRIAKASKHIFLRDIKKQWYLTGINARLNSIEKVLEFLKRESSGYKIITVGSSAGGYASVLFGQLLKAEKILTFNGQFYLTSLLKQSSEKTDPIIFREQNNEKINKYYNLKNYIVYPKSIFYFFANKSSWDMEQQLNIKNISLNYISFNTRHHGIPFLKTSLPYVINLPKTKLKKLSGNKINPILFSIKMEGLNTTIKGIIMQTIIYIKKRIQKNYYDK